MQKWILFGLIVIGGIFGVTLMLAQTPPSPEQIAKENANTLKVTATNFQFDKAEYHVKVGSTLTVKLDLKEGIHGLGIPALGVALSGDKLEQKVTFDKKGTYDMHCIVLCGSGHPNMKATLIVE